MGNRFLPTVAMKRRQFIEWEDLAWWPRTFRDSCTDYLQLLAREFKPYRVVVPILAEAIRKCEATKVVDLCSGAGSSWWYLLPALHEEGVPVHLYLSDKFPNSSAFTSLARVLPRVTPVMNSVDALNIPRELKGFLTLFTAFHHLNPREARQLLAKALEDREGIGIFEGTHRSLARLIQLLLTPFNVWLLTPFVRPFRWSRLFWTYILPVLPFAIMWDGIVSCLRTYTPEELLEMVQEVDPDNTFEWDIGMNSDSESQSPIIYLIGVPCKK